MPGSLSSTPKRQEQATIFRVATSDSMRAGQPTGDLPVEDEKASIAQVDFRRISPSSRNPENDEDDDEDERIDCQFTCGDRAVLLTSVDQNRTNCRECRERPAPPHGGERSDGRQPGGRRREQRYIVRLNFHSHRPAR
jgi:hypothetical protein